MNELINIIGMTFILLGLRNLKKRHGSVGG
jgi:hypothetical protein